MVLSLWEMLHGACHDAQGDKVPAGLYSLSWEACQLQAICCALGRPLVSSAAAVGSTGRCLPPQAL